MLEVHTLASLTSCLGRDYWFQIGPINADHWELCPSPSGYHVRRKPTNTVATIARRFLGTEEHVLTQWELGYQHEAMVLENTPRCAKAL